MLATKNRSRPTYSGGARQRLHPRRFASSHRCVARCVSWWTARPTRGRHAQTSARDRDRETLMCVVSGLRPSRALSIFVFVKKKTANVRACCIVGSLGLRGVQKTQLVAPTSSRAPISPICGKSCASGVDALNSRAIASSSRSTAERGEEALTSRFTERAKLLKAMPKRWRRSAWTRRSAVSIRWRGRSADQLTAVLALKSLFPRLALALGHSLHLYRFDETLASTGATVYPDRLDRSLRARNLAARDTRRR